MLTKYEAGGDEIQVQYGRRNVQIDSSKNMWWITFTEFTDIVVELKVISVEHKKTRSMWTTLLRKTDILLRIEVTSNIFVKIIHSPRQNFTWGGRDLAEICGNQNANSSGRFILKNSLLGCFFIIKNPFKSRQQNSNIFHFAGTSWKTDNKLRLDFTFRVVLLTQKRRLQNIRRGEWNSSTIWT